MTTLEQLLTLGDPKDPELHEPKDTVAPGEKVLGILSKLAIALFIMTEGERKLLKKMTLEALPNIGRMLITTPSSDEVSIRENLTAFRKKINDQRAKVEKLMDIFWFEVTETLGSAYTGKSIAVRSGWQVVEEVQKPFGVLPDLDFSGLFGKFADLDQEEGCGNPECPIHGHLYQEGGRVQEPKEA